MLNRPAGNGALVVKRYDAAFVKQLRGFDSHPVLEAWNPWFPPRIFDNSIAGAHEVAVAYRLAMAEVRVQIPLSALLRDPLRWFAHPEGQTDGRRKPF